MDTATGQTVVKCGSLASPYATRYDRSLRSWRDFQLQPLENCMNAPDVKIADLLKTEPPTSSRSVSLIGMIRPGKQESTFGFAFGSCDSWVELPLSSVQKCRHFGERACKDHMHHAVQLDLTPTDDGKMWFELLSQVLERARTAPVASAAAAKNSSGSTSLWMSCFECWFRGGFEDECWNNGACK